MKSVIFKIIFVFICKISLIKLDDNNLISQKKYLRKSIKESINGTEDKNNTLIINDLGLEKFKNFAKIDFDSIILNLRIIENKIKTFKQKLEMKNNLVKNQDLIFQTFTDKVNPNLINEYFLNEYIDLSKDIEYFLYDVEILQNKNMTESLNILDADLFSKFYDMTKKYSIKKKKINEKSLEFYNGISLLILSILIGGIIGVIIIIYNSFKSGNKQNIFHK